MAPNEQVYDTAIIGAGPGGLQASIYLGRYNRKVIILDRGGGRTKHARHIENFLTQPSISGSEIIDIGIKQATNFGATFIKTTVLDIKKTDYFEVQTDSGSYDAKFVIVSSGVYDNLPPIENLHRFLGEGFFTCIDCDGYKTTGKKLAVIGNSIHTADLALAMKELYTKEITLLLYFVSLPDDYLELLKDEGIALAHGRPERILGEGQLEGIMMKDGSVLECEAVMSNFGFKLNDGFLKNAGLKQDSEGFKYIVSRQYESSLDGLYIIGPLNTGNDQAIIAAGEGAVAAIDINKRLLRL